MIWTKVYRLRSGRWKVARIQTLLKLFKTCAVTQRRTQTNHGDGKGQYHNSQYILRMWILLMTTKFWKPIGSSKLIRHPRWDFFAPVNSTGRGVPPPPSTSSLQLLCQGCPSMQCENRTNNVATDWWPAQADTLAPLPLAGDITSLYFIVTLHAVVVYEIIMILVFILMKLFFISHYIY